MEIEIDKNKTEVEIYEGILSAMEHLIVPTDKLISNLTNFVALIKQAFSKISWIGFYIAESEKLFLGPFQGNTACTEIKIGSGVCGTSAARQEIIIVNDVDKFAGHIACDSNSKSEIVVPIVVNRKVWGVLDVDSYKYSAFTETDKLYLGKLVSILINKLKLNNYILK